jgi:hypothetical protein
MPGNSSWMPYAPQEVKGFDDNETTGCFYKWSFKKNVWEN